MATRLVTNDYDRTFAVDTMEHSSFTADYDIDVAFGADLVVAGGGNTVDIYEEISCGDSAGMQVDGGDNSLHIGKGASISGQFGALPQTTNATALVNDGKITQEGDDVHISISGGHGGHTTLEHTEVVNSAKMTTR